MKSFKPYLHPILLLILPLLVTLISTNAYSHRSGCHRWHSCPSDSGTYVCGDTGYCSQCPDNRYCKDGKPRSDSTLPPVSNPTKPKQPPPAIQSLEMKAHVLRVIDGDTLELSGGERVRLIGIDTPETVHPNKPVEYFGKEASQFTKTMVEGKNVKLTFDHQLRDKYGRLLAYIYLEDGTFLNAEIVKQGYGHAYTRFPFKYIEEFREYEKEARESGKGLWETLSKPPF